MAPRINEEYADSLGGRAEAEVNQQTQPLKGEKVGIRAAQWRTQEDTSWSWTHSSIAFGPHVVDVWLGEQNQPAKNQLRVSNGE